MFALILQQNDPKEITALGITQAATSQTNKKITALIGIFLGNT